MRKVTKLFYLLLFVCLFGCSNEIDDLVISLEKDISLKEANTIELVERILDRKKVRKQIYSAPFAVVVDKNENVIYSFYKKERVIFAGESTSAWHDRMIGGDSECYPLLLEDVKTLIKLNKRPNK